MATGRVDVENINHPGSRRSVAALPYRTVRRALLRILPRGSPGLTADEIRERLAADVPVEVFAEGAKVGWWAKTVQLDLEAKGLIVREKTSPLRFHRLAVPNRAAEVAS